MEEKREREAESTREEKEREKKETSTFVRPILWRMSHATVDDT